MVVGHSAGPPRRATNPAGTGATANHALPCIVGVDHDGVVICKRTGALERDRFRRRADEENRPCVGACPNASCAECAGGGIYRCGRTEHPMPQISAMVHKCQTDC